jgi:hypothetical protein
LFTVAVAAISLIVGGIGIANILPSARSSAAPAGPAHGHRRMRPDDLEGARIRTGQGVPAHNLVQIAALAS